MARFVIVLALALVAACSGATRRVLGTNEEAGSAAERPEAPVLAKKIALSWGIEQHGETADVFLATTDETGKQVSHPLGRYEGTCTVITPAPEMHAATGVACRRSAAGATGTELHAVIERGAEIIVLKLGVAEGVAPDPMAREEVARVKVPLGTKIEAGGG